MAAGPTTRAEYAQRYGALGLPVFPLHWVVRDAGGLARCSCDDLDCRSPGKHPLTANGVKDASTDALILAASWGRWPEANIGLAMGAASGLFAVDVDPRNGGDTTIEELQAKHGRFADTINALTGGGGQHILFKFDASRKLPGKLGHGVDVKGEGGYIVVEPSMHVSGITYAWEADGDPLEGATAAAPPEWLFTPVATAAAPAAIAAGAVGFLAPDRVLAIRSALSFLDADDRDTWVRVGMALRETGAPNAFGLWTEWSQLSSKYDATAQRKTWDSFKPEGRIHVESIFTLAAAAGWVNPASNLATRFTEEQQRALERMNGDDRVVLLPDTRSVVRPFPCRLLQDAQQWVERQSPIHHPLIAQQTVLALIATTASRIYVSDDGDTCNLYLNIVADTVDYARPAGDTLKRIFTESGLRRMIRGTRLGTAAAIYSTLLKSPSSVYVSDEWGHLIAFAKRQPSGAIDQAMNLLTSVYSMPVIHLDNAAEAGLKASGLDDQLVIYQPALTVLAFMSADQMAPMMRRGEMGKGALSQMLSVFVEADELVERKPDAGPVPQWLIDRLLQVRRLPAGFAGDRSTQEIFGGQPGLKPQLVRVRCRLDIDEALQVIDEIGHDMKTRPFVLAAKRIARRIATAIAAWDNPAMPEITAPILEWSAQYVRDQVGAWFERFQTMSSDEGKVSVMQQVLELIERSRTGGISQREITHQCWAFRNLTREKREELVGTLIGDEGVVQISTKNGQGKLFVASRFAKQQASLGAAGGENPQHLINTSNSDNSLKNVVNFKRC